MESNWNPLSNKIGNHGNVDLLSLSFCTHCWHKLVEESSTCLCKQLKTLWKELISRMVILMISFVWLDCLWCCKTSCFRCLWWKIYMGEVNNDDFCASVNPQLGKDNVEATPRCLKCGSLGRTCNCSWVIWK